MPARLIAALHSAKLALGLLLILAVLAAVGTLPVEEPAKGDAARPGTAISRLLGLRETFRSPVFVATVSMLVANILLCTVRRFRRAQRRNIALLTDIAMHLSLVLVVAGGAIKGGLGVVRTVVVPVGTEARSAYDWRVASDAPLGFAIRVERLEIEYYPLRARIGLTDQRTGTKLGILEVSEGASGGASRDRVTVELLGVDRERGRAALRVTTPAAEEQISLGLAAGPASSTQAGGVGFTLVAYRDEERMVRALVTLTQAGGATSERWLAPNGSIGVEGEQVCLTAWGKDEFGNPFAGFQITRDPGAPLFWGGVILLACAVLLHFLLKRRQRPPAPPAAAEARR